jgi:type I restriction enzyme M protein
MLTGEIQNQIDRIWDAFWSGGIANPVDVIEQITYLLFLKRLDEVQEVEELKASRLKRPIARRIFREGNDPKGVPYEDYRWKRFKNAEAGAMYERAQDHIFPFLRTLGDDCHNDAIEHRLRKPALWLVSLCDA